MTQIPISNRKTRNIYHLIALLSDKSSIFAEYDDRNILLSIQNISNDVYVCFTLKWEQAVWRCEKKNVFLYLENILNV